MKLMKALELSNYIINYAIEHQKHVSNLMLQKILYFCQISSYKNSGDRIITDHGFEAWMFGPVCREVYVEYCLYGSEPIKGEPKKSDLFVPMYIQDTINKCLNKGPWALVHYSHSKEGAWAKTYIPGLKNKIPEEYIKQEALNGTEQI